MSMTRGKTSVTLTIRAAGSIFTYAPIFTYVPQYQSLMASPSESIYAAYTHAGSFLDASTEAQGTAPAVATPRTVETEAGSIATVESGVNGQLAHDLQASPSTLGQKDADFMADCYDASVNAGASWITYPSGKSSTDLGNEVITIIDNLVTSYAADSSVAGSDWGGGFAPMGDAIRLTWPLISSSMSATVSYGGSLGTITRKAAWAAALRASVDDGRYGRQTIANQAMHNGNDIYYENRALLLVDSTKALNDSEAIRYIKEAAGISPWLGNDQATGGTDGLGGGPVPTRGTAPYGTSWYMCTTKGTTKDGEGFVGSDYGEVGPALYRVGLLSGDAQLKARAILMTQVRDNFRYPGVDANGFLEMYGVNTIGERNNNLPGWQDYVGTSNTDDFLMVSQGASAIGSDLLGYMQEEINDGQAYHTFYYQDPYLPSRWATIKAQAQTNTRLPMAVGQPDFAWADEENMVVAAKHGEERFFVNLFWRQAPFINGLAKVLDLTPSLARIGDVMADDVSFRSTGQTITTGSAVDTFATPEDNPKEAFGGLPVSIAYRSDLSAVPAINRDAGRGTGYTLRYGNWLVGINANYSATYTVKLPSNFTSATDLISGKVMSGPIVLQPKTSVVFFLPDTVDPAPTPSRSLYTNAVGGNGGITVSWANSGAASTYNLLRSTTSGGPYTTLATGLTATSYIDTTASSGTTYYYVVDSVNSIGVSGNSPEASAMLVAPETAGLPSPWTDVDVGASTGGTATLSGGTFTVKSGPGVIGGTNDGFHLVYQPMAGDGSITARVQSQTGPNGGAVAGLSIRDNLDINATMAVEGLQANNKADFYLCGGDGGSASGSSYSTSIAAPYWVRLVRAGLTVTGFISPDGVTWTQTANYTFSSLPYVTYVGLYVETGNASSGQTNTAVFTNVTLPSGATAVASAPTGLTTLSATAASASLSWTAPVGAFSYNVKRGTSASGPFTTVASGVDTNSYTDYGLVNGATYYYVVSAVNSAGESADSSAATAALLPPPATLSGLTVAASGTQSVLTWASSSGATSYVVSRATTYAGPYTVIASGVTGDSYTDTGLSSTTLYYYKVTPTNSAGSGTGGTISSISAGLPAPWLTQDIGSNVPGGAYASSGVFNLFGSGYVYGYRGEPCRYVYQTVTGDSAMTIRITGQSSANHDITGIMIRDTMDPGSRYIYLNLVSTASGSTVNYEYRSTLGGAISSNYSGIISATPCWLRVARLGAYTALYTSPDGKAWTQFAVPNFAMNPIVCIGMATSSGDPGAINTATIDNVAVTAGVNVGGTATASSDNAGAGAGAAQAFDDNIGTKWYDSAADTGWLQYQFAGGAAYAVHQYQLISGNDVPHRDPAAWQFQGSNDGTNWTTLDTQTGQVFAARLQANVYNITNTTAYSYYRLNVTANAGGGGGVGVQLSELGLYTANAGTTLVPPAAPLDLSSDWNSSQIALSWDATFAATSYKVKRATVSGGPYTTIASGVATTSYNDTSIADGTTYYYVVSAVNGGGESANSIENSAAAYAIPATPTGVTATAGSTQVTLNWTAVAGASQYWIGRATTSGGPYTDLGFVSGTSFADSALTNYTTYYYVVAALNLGELSGNSTQISAIPLPSDAPWNFNSTAGNTVVALTWNAPPGATGYAVKRSTTSGGPYTTVIANTPGISYVDTGLTNGTAYYYIITPLFGASAGDDSVQISATPSSSTTLLVRSKSGSGTGTTAAGDSPQESPLQAFDGNISTKWYTQTAPTASQPDWLQYQFGNNLAWAITQYTITSASDVPQRDPASWQLLGSNDGATWATLDTRSGQTFSGRNTTNSYTFTNTTPYRYYRLSVTADSGGAGSGYGVQLAEFTLYSSPSDVGDKAPPVLTLPSNISTPATSGSGAYVSFSVTANDAVSGALTPSVTPPSGSQFPIGTTTVQCSAIDLAGNTSTGSFTVTVTGTPGVASASAGASGEQAAQAFDTSLGTKWYNGVTGGTGWLQYQFANSAAKVVQGYAITSANDVPQRDPAAWQFEGSQNGSTWTVLDTQSAQSFSARYLTKLYPITNTTAYAYYRLNVTANSGGSGYGVQLSELTFIYPLASPWSTADIGTTGIAGAVGSDSGIYTMVGAGTDITGTSDSFRYAYQTASGDCSITARVAAFANFNSGPRVGVMIRESLNANSTHATLALTPSSGLVVRYRSTTGAGTTSSGGSGSAPYWVRVTRSGNTFTFYSSSDGATWTTLSTTTISMATNVYIGLVETSGTAGTLTISNVDNVTAAP